MLRNILHRGIKISRFESSLTYQIQVSQVLSTCSTHGHQLALHAFSNSKNQALKVLISGHFWKCNL